MISRCIELAGGSPVQVSAGAPGSRPRAQGETPVSRAGRRKPSERREQDRGPQSEVNAEQASLDYQPKGAWECRAAHVTAKAMHTTQEPEREVGLPGVLAVARGDSSMRNRRGPTRQPTSGTADRISAEREIGRCREGVRGGRSTGEGREKRPEGRAPGLVTPGEQVSARAWS
jgi:hypothetical protein